MAKLIKVTPNPFGNINTLEYVEPRNGHDFSLSELQGFVNGYVERLDLFDGTEMWCNEEGAITDGVPYNPTASGIATMAYGHTIQIYGNVLICNNGEVL